jgi:5-methylcytosine-specific restriction endonuclease McrA
MNYFDELLSCPECGKQHARRDWPVFKSSGKPRRTCCLTTGHNNKKKYQSRFKVVDGVSCALCLSCGKHLPVNQYHKSRENLKSICKNCHRDRYKDYRSAAKKAASELVKKRKEEKENQILKCERCGQAKKRRDWPRLPSSNVLTKFCCLSGRIKENRELKEKNLKRCSICDEVKKLSQFNKNAGKCKPCLAAYSTSYASRARRQDQISKTDDGTLDAKTKSSLFSNAKKCPICSSSMSWDDKQLDHIIPLSKNGTHSLSNVIVICRACNAQKRAKNLEQWLSDLPKEQVTSYRSALRERPELRLVLERVDKWLQGVA